MKDPFAATVPTGAFDAFSAEVSRKWRGRGSSVRALRLMPHIFTEGKIDSDKLRQSAGDLLDDRPERFSFNWAGRQNAIRILQTSTRATLVPCPEESDERGPYRDDGNINWPGGGGPRYEVLLPQKKKPSKLPTSGWRYRPDWAIVMDPPVKAGRSHFGSTTPATTGALDGVKSDRLLESKA